VGWQPGSGGVAQAALIQRWNGSTWSSVNAASPDYANYLAGVDVVGQDRLAVGYHTGGSSGDWYHTLGEVSCAA